MRLKRQGRKQNAKKLTIKSNPISVEDMKNKIGSVEACFKARSGCNLGFGLYHQP